MKKLSIGAVTTGAGLAIIILSTYLLASFLPGTFSRVEASRLIVQDGDLYRASDVFGSKRLSDTSDIRILFGKQNGKLLVGKGLEGNEGGNHSSPSSHLYLMNEDGSGEIAVSDQKKVEYAFFDHSGENIFFETREADIYRYNVTLNKTDRIQGGGTHPDLSPDGKKLLYQIIPVGWVPGNDFIGTPGFGIKSIETGDEKVINEEEGYSPLWTPDGKHIAYFGNGGFFIMSADGTERTRLTEVGDGSGAYGIGDSPLWSSDGRYFLYKDDAGVVLIELDIWNKRVITAGHIARGVEPHWVEEGKSISVLAPNAPAGASELTVVDLWGKVIRGDKTIGIKGERVKPQKVTPPPAQIIREISQDLIGPEGKLPPGDFKGSQLPKESPLDLPKETNR